MSLSRVLTLGIFAILVIVLVLILLLVIIPLRIFLRIVNIPNTIGGKLGLEKIFKSVLYSVVDKNEIEFFRDEFMEVLHPKIEYRGSIERWGLEREMDLHRERAIEDLRKGEQFIALFGGFFALILGYGFGLGFGALAISLAVLFFTLTVGFRIIVVDILAYSSIQHRSASISELAKMKTWNEGPLRGRSGVGVVIVSLITSQGSLGHELGMSLMDDLSDIFIDYDSQKWESLDTKE